MFKIALLVRNFLKIVQTFLFPYLLLILSLYYIIFSERHFYTDLINEKSTGNGFNSNLIVLYRIVYSKNILLIFKERKRHPCDEYLKYNWILNILKKYLGGIILGFWECQIYFVKHCRQIFAS